MHHRLLTMFSHSLESLLRTAIGFAHAHRISFKVYDTHNVVLFKFAPHINEERRMKNWAVLSYPMKVLHLSFLIPHFSGY